MTRSKRVYVGVPEVVVGRTNSSGIPSRLANGGMENSTIRADFGWVEESLRPGCCHKTASLKGSSRRHDVKER